MDQHLLFGLVCCTLLVVFFLVRGRKNDTVSWLVLIIGIAAILVIIANWSAIAHWWPTITAAHAAPVLTPATVHAAQPEVVPGTPAPSATTPFPLTRLAVALSSVVVIVLLVAMAFLVVALFIARAKRQPRHSQILHTRSVCRECHQEGEMRQYRYQQGRTRILGNLCQQCARRLQATLARNNQCRATTRKN